MKSDAKVSYLRLQAAAHLYSGRFEVFIAGVTLLNFFMILMDTDITARGDEVPWWLRTADVLCLLIFAGELVLRVFVERRKSYKDAWNVLDVIVVIGGFLSTFFDLIKSDSIPLGPLRTMRSLRLLRMLKAFVLVNH